MHEILFFAGRFPIRTYGVIAAVTIVGGFFLTARQGRRLGIPTSPLLDAVAAGVFGGVIGARLLYVIVQWPQYVADPLRVLRFYEGGSVFFGGLLLGALFAGLMCRVRGIDWRTAFDAAMPAVAGGMVLGRLACLSAGCCYGRPTELPWAIALAGASRHPSQAYQSMAGAILFVTMLYVVRRTNRPGTASLIFALLAATSRFIMEMWRGDIERGFVGPLSTSQTIALVAMAIAAGALLWRRFHPPPHPAPAA